MINKFFLIHFTKTKKLLQKKLLLRLLKYLVNLKRIKMKKLFFSALALVAFSAVSMANTSEEIVGNRCRPVFEATFNNALQNGYTADEAWAIASFAYDLCDRNVILAP